MIPVFMKKPVQLQSEMLIMRVLNFYPEPIEYQDYKNEIYIQERKLSNEDYSLPGQ